MSLLKKLVSIIKGTEIDLEKTISDHIYYMGDGADTIQKLKEGTIEQSEADFFRDLIAEYLEELKSFRNKISNKTSRSQLYRFDTTYRQLEQQYDWFFGKSD